MAPILAPSPVVENRALVWKPVLTDIMRLGRFGLGGGDSNAVMKAQGLPHSAFAMRRRDRLGLCA